MQADQLDKLAVLEIQLDNLIKHKDMVNKTHNHPIINKIYSDNKEAYYIQKEFIEGQIKEILCNT